MHTRLLVRSPESRHQSRSYLTANMLTNSRMHVDVRVLIYMEDERDSEEVVPAQEGRR